MKTRRQKVFAILSACFLCASFFAVPVSAADQLTTVAVENIIYEYGMDHTGSGELDVRPYSSFYLYEPTFSNISFSLFDTYTAFIERFLIDSPLISTSGSSYMGFEYPSLNPSLNHFGIYFINNLFDDGVVRTFSRGDTVFLDSSFFPILLYDGARLTNYRFTIRDYGDPYNFYFGNVVASTDIISANVTDEDSGFDYDRLAFNFNNTVSSSELCLCLEFQLDIVQDELYFEIEKTSLTFQFGAGVSPDYPIYPSAPGGDDVGNLDSAEQELIQGSQQGLNNAADNFASFGDRIRSFSTCFIRIANYLNRIVGNTPYLDLVLWISLSLGIYASLLGLAGAIVSASDRKAGREAAAAARTAQNERLARAIERSRKG